MEDLFEDIFLLNLHSGHGSAYVPLSNVIRIPNPSFNLIQQIRAMTNKLCVREFPDLIFGGNFGPSRGLVHFMKSVPTPIRIVTPAGKVDFGGTDMFNCRTKEEKLECLKYEGRTVDAKSWTLEMKKLVPEAFQEIKC